MYKDLGPRCWEKSLLESQYHCTRLHITTVFLSHFSSLCNSSVSKPCWLFIGRDFMCIFLSLLTFTIVFDTFITSYLKQLHPWLISLPPPICSVYFYYTDIAKNLQWFSMSSMVFKEFHKSPPSCLFSPAQIFLSQTSFYTVSKCATGIQTSLFLDNFLYQEDFPLSMFS